MKINTLTTAQIDALELFNLTQNVEIETIHVENVQTDVDEYDMSDLDREALLDQTDAAAEFLREAQIEADCDAYLMDAGAEAYADAVLEADDSDWDAVASFCDC